MTLNVTIGSAAPVEVADAAAPMRRRKLGLGAGSASTESGRAPASRRERRLIVEEAQGHAAEAGIQPGDVVLSVDGTPVQSAVQLRKMVQEHDKQVALLIQRGNSRLFVPVTLG